MAEFGSWDGISKYGLLSTSALLDLFEVTGRRREAIESCRRASSVTISHPKHGTAIIRDQKPISDSKLIKCLQDCSPRDWYQLLNSRVFFWPTEDKVLNLLSARAYRKCKHTIIVVNSEPLIRKYQSNVYLSPINTGAVVYRPTARGPKTFIPFNNWPSDVKRTTGKLRKEVTEVAFEYGILDIVRYVLYIAEGEKGRIYRL